MTHINFIYIQTLFHMNFQYFKEQIFTNWLTSYVSKTNSHHDRYYEVASAQ
jgi:hypothetical protein